MYTQRSNSLEIEYFYNNFFVKFFFILNYLNILGLSRII